MSVEQPGWRELREALWSEATPDEHRAEMRSFLDKPERYAAFVAYGEDGAALAFAEAAIRTDYVNGTTTSPVAFLEGLYVVPGARRKRIGTNLLETVAAWAVRAGCAELASDALLENEAAHAFHRGSDFTETERVVYFRRELAG